VAKVYHLSREDAQSLFSKKLVFLNGRCMESLSHTPKCGDVVSVRGYGRFIYRGFESNTKKGKLNLTVEIYL
jgi:RNA-binding protein YlmH